MNLAITAQLAALACLGLAATVLADTSKSKPKSPVIALFEDDPALILKQFTNPEAPSGQASRENSDKYSGICSIRVRPLQNFNPMMQGWSFPIVEKPALGQYRYIRFAWKKLGGKAIMLQLSDHGNWDRRYVAGNPSVSWLARKVAEKAPADWVVVTRDLCKDFGPFVLTGLALTPLDGTAGLYDHIYLGRTIADLDRTDAAGLGKAPLKKDLTRQRLQQLWYDLASRDVSVAYPAVWTLVAASKQSVPLFKERLRPTVFKVDRQRIAQLIRDLDDNRFAVREQASDQLEKLGRAAVPFLQKVLDEPCSAEVRHRTDLILKHVGAAAKDWTPEQLRMARAIRILEQIGSAEARQVLQTLASGAAQSELTQAALAALRRLDRRAVGWHKGK